MLGPPRATCAGELWRPPTARAFVIAAFLAYKNKAVSRETLMTFLWDAPEKTARHRLRQEIYRLHHSPLGPFIESERATLRLKNVGSDAADFILSSTRGDLDRAIALYRGEFMEGLSLNRAEVFNDWLTLERETWRNRLIHTLGRRASLREGEGDLDAAIADWQEVLKLDSLNEKGIRQIMRLLAAANRWEDADRAYQDYRARLLDETGLEPEKETTELHENLREKALSAPIIYAPLPQILSNPPLVGRDSAIAAVNLSRKPVIIYGEAGSGKSRLAREAASRLGGALVVDHSSSATALPFSGVARTLDTALADRDPKTLDLDTVWLHEVGRLLPHRTASSPRPIRSVAEQARFLEGVSRTLIALSPGVLVWEDLQWSDDPSLEVLSKVILLARDCGLRLIITVRTPVLRPKIGEWLTRMRAGAEVREVELAPLSEDDIHLLIKKMAHQRYGARFFAKRLRQATGGNPYFVIETLRHLFARGELRLSKEGWSTPYDRTTKDYRELPVPGSVLEVLRARVGALGNQLRRSLLLLALAGEPVQSELLAEVLGVSEMEATAHLEMLTEQQLLQSGSGGFSPAHEHLRRLLLEMPNPTMRNTYHRAWARALAKNGNLAASAYHWLQAGERAKAAKVFLEAARAVRSSPLAALPLYEKALDLMEYLNDDEALSAEMEFLEIKVRLGQIQNETQKRLAELAERGLAQPRLLQAELCLQRGDFSEARYLSQLGLELAIAEENHAQEAGAHFLLAWIHYRYGDPDAQLKELEQALRAYQRAGDLKGGARALRNLAALNFRLGKKDEGDRLQNEAERLARKAADLILAMRIRADKTTGMWLRAEYSAARRGAIRLLKDARRLGDLGGQLDALELLGLSLYKLGHNDAALETFDEFVKLAARFDSKKDLALARSERALPLAEMRQWQRAKSDLHKALKAQQEIGDQAKIGHTLYTLGYVCFLKGNLEESLDWLIKAAAHWRSRGEEGHLARSLALAALAAMHSGLRQRARRYSKEALRAAAAWRVGVPDEPLVYAIYGRLYGDRDASAHARALLDGIAAGLTRKDKKSFAGTFIHRIINDL